MTQDIIIFLISSVAIWYFCIKLADIVDFIDYHFDIGSGFGGTIILSVVTNLPEIAITISGSLRGDASLAFGNLIGGIAMQTLLLVVFDFSNKSEKRPLSFLFDRKIALVQVVILIVILFLVLAGTQTKSSLEVEFGVAILLVWIGGLFLIKKYQKPDAISVEQKQLFENKNPKMALLWLGIVSVVVLVCGVLLENTGNNIANHFDINGVIFGATVLALITSTPELSSGLEFVKNKSYQPIASDIFGGNAFLPVLLLLAMLLSSAPIFNKNDYLNIDLAILGIILSAIYMVSIFFGIQKKYFRMGIDSWIVLFVYIISMFYILTIK